MASPQTYYIEDRFGGEFWNSGTGLADSTSGAFILIILSCIVWIKYKY
jgi:hypothetical protein